MNKTKNDIIIDLKKFLFNISEISQFNYVDISLMIEKLQKYIEQFPNLLTNYFFNIQKLTQENELYQNEIIKLNKKYPNSKSYVLFYTESNLQERIVEELNNVIIKLEAISNNNEESFTKKEKEIYKLISNNLDYTVRDIAELLKVEPTTIQTHIKNIAEKLGYFEKYFNSIKKHIKKNPNLS